MAIASRRSPTAARYCIKLVVANLETRGPVVDHLGGAAKLFAVIVVN
jgi:hypothetical protein